MSGMDGSGALPAGLALLEKGAHPFLEIGASETLLYKVMIVRERHRLAKPLQAAHGGVKRQRCQTGDALGHLLSPGKHSLPVVQQFRNETG